MKHSVLKSTVMIVTILMMTTILAGCDQSTTEKVILPRVEESVEHTSEVVDKETLKREAKKIAEEILAEKDAEEATIAVEETANDPYSNLYGLWLNHNGCAGWYFDADTGESCRYSAVDGETWYPAGGYFTDGGKTYFPGGATHGLTINAGVSGDNMISIDGNQYYFIRSTPRVSSDVF